MPKVWWWGRRSRGAATVQRRLAFVVRAERRERAFKRAIVSLTTLVLVGLAGGTSSGRYAAANLTFQARALWDRVLGAPPDRAAYEARLRLERLHSAASARRALAEVAAPGSALDVFLRTASMDAKSAVIRWANVDHSIVLSSAVFEPDDDRSYRLKPRVRSVWVIGLSFESVLAMFLIPDTPEARAAAERAGGRVVRSSLQTTNSWGCRGPEPDTTAPVRVIVLGDSMMQGALVGDTESPPARLEAQLSHALAAPVSVLNTGHIGYSVEQYDQTLRAFGDRFHPHYVVISICGNDFGDRGNPANWVEGKYWLDRITNLCYQRRWEYLLVPGPGQSTLTGPRNLHEYQCQVNGIFGHGGTQYVDPLEAFTDALLRVQNDGSRKGVKDPDPFYNTRFLGDQHHSALGSDVWARAVARRLLLVWDSQLLNGFPGPEPVLRHARSAHPVIPDDDPQG
jgi:GDSL-like Lipase/Acylhydrolase family